MDISAIRTKSESLREEMLASENSVLAPSKLASQFYCEKKVDLAREIGEVETAAKQQGTQVHEEAAAQSEEVSDDEFWQMMERGERSVMVESSFVGEAAEFYLLGKPDAVVFDNGKPQLIFERKATSYPERLYKNQTIQTWFYGYILDSLGFETDELDIGLLAHELDIDTSVGELYQRRVLSSYDELEYGDHILSESPQARLELSEFSLSQHLEDLDWVLGYWRDDREPVPTKQAGKCRSCEYRDSCEASLA